MKNKLISLFFVIGFSCNSIIGSQEMKGFTVQNALVYMRKIIDNFPRDNAPAAQAYEKKESSSLTKCAYALYSSARTQILEALREIDNRKNYWQYQRDHQWQYFLTKNPLKWITGQSQDLEIQNNLDLLESHQGELYVLLGQLLEQGNIFTQGYKTSFLTNYNKGYEWIDGLLNLLSRIKVAEYSKDESSPFMARATELKIKLEGIGYFKSDILSDIKETQVPSKFEQNWLKYGTLGLVLGYGYNAGGVEKLKNSFDYVSEELKNYVVTPVQELMEEVFVGGKKNEVDKVNEAEPAPLLSTTKQTLELAEKFVDDMSKKYKLDSDAEKIKRIKIAMSKGDYEEFYNFLEDIKNTNTWTWLHPMESANLSISAPLDYAYGKDFFIELLVPKVAGEKIEEKQKLVLEEFAKLKGQFAGVSKLVLLTPAVLTGALAYVGYQAATTKNYSQIRRALVDINSLFVDQSKPLDDESYGKMVYLLYNLKKLAEKDLPQKKNIRADFLHDLDKIESKEFDVAAKGRIIDNMFRKYSFLGLV